MSVRWTVLTVILGERYEMCSPTELIGICGIICQNLCVIKLVQNINRNLATKAVSH